MPDQTITLRTFAKSLGVSHVAVSKAIAGGRLVQSVGRDAAGHPVILDQALAEREWRDNRSRPATAGKGPRSRQEKATKGGTLAEAQRLQALERYRALKLRNDLQAGRLVEVAKVAKEAFESARIVRDALLNIPARVSAELAAETDTAKVYTRLDTEIRQALEAAAKQLSTDAA